MGRKVAASLDLFRETTSADELDDVGQPLVSSRRRRVSSKHLPQSNAEPEFSFFKRSEWLDRETVVPRREQSSVTRDRARTRDGSFPTSVSRSVTDSQRRNHRPQSVRENVISDLVNWRTDVLGDLYQDRGRPRKRSLDSHHHTDTVDHQLLHRNEPSSFRHPRDFQCSPSSPSSVSLLTSPIVPSAIIADSPLAHQGALPSANVPNSPYITEDEDDDSSNWDDETASDYGTTASTTSPWPSSPLHTGASLSPMVNPSVHHDDHDEDGDDEDPGLVIPSRAHRPTVPPELSDLHPYLSNFQGEDLEEYGPSHQIFSTKLQNFSQESLPHIPLRPFRNQVGGHSAIYKFTKRAVCKVCWFIHISDHSKVSNRSFPKPLVSRENIFYEAVEHEAPPLLGFIPRYLGVMLVTYRRVKSSEHSPTSSDDRKPRPVLHKANTVAPLQSTFANDQFTSEGHSIVPHVVTGPRSSFVEDDSGDTETEFPEVALDRNTHIVPHWLLKHNHAGKRRLRAASMSQPNSPSDARPYLSPALGSGAMVRRKFGGATLSTPDLGIESRFCPQPSPLSMHATLRSAAPTPDNSPKIFGRFLNTAGGHDHRTPSTPPMMPNAVSSMGLKPACGFGGTGSTVVNTKLKDHIFSTILKRMTKRHRISNGRRWRVDDDGDAADNEGESGPSPKKRSAINHLPAIEVTRSRGCFGEGYGLIRRTHSEEMTASTENTMSVARKSNDPPSPGHGDVFHMELDSAEEDIHMKQTLGSSFLPLARKRSRSRSLGPGPGLSIFPSHPSLAVPRGHCDSKTPVPPSRALLTQPIPPPAKVESSPTSTASSSPRQNHFILMEDLTGKLKKPCVLDLKMGTRQYGMDATPGKKKSQRKKCDRTTSRSLGVRVCGMQVSWTELLYIPRIGDFLFAEFRVCIGIPFNGPLPFLTSPFCLISPLNAPLLTLNPAHLRRDTHQVWNNASESYVTQNKYSGREIKTDDFAAVLASFLHDGERLLVHQIPILLSKIYSLARIINRLKGYRFYGCSVLLIYDGDHEVQDVLISQTCEQPSSRRQRGKSLERRENHQNYMSGSSGHPTSAHTIRQSPDADGESTDQGPPSTLPLPTPLRRSHSEDLMVGPAAKRCHNSRPRKRGEVNLRIVDFAHTTTGQDWLPYPDPSMDKYSPEYLNAQHPKVEEVSSGKGYVADIDPATGCIYARFPPHYPDQPDRGFLWGLKNVAETLESLWNQERVRRMKGSGTTVSPGSVHSPPSSVYDAEQLPPLSTYGKEIFAEVFGEDNENLGYISS